MHPMKASIQSALLDHTVVIVHMKKKLGILAVYKGARED